MSSIFLFPACFGRYNIKSAKRKTQNRKEQKMITLTLSRVDAALLARRLEDDRRLVNLKLAEMASNLPDAIYAMRTEQQRDELAHLDRVLAAIRAAQDAQDAQKGD
jgi:hypothetical protein